MVTVQSPTVIRAFTFPLNDTDGRCILCYRGVTPVTNTSNEFYFNHAYYISSVYPNGKRVQADNLLVPVEIYGVKC